MLLDGNSKDQKRAIPRSLHSRSEVFLLSWYHTHLSQFSAMAQSIFSLDNTLPPPNERHRLHAQAQPDDVGYS